MRSKILGVLVTLASFGCLIIAPTASASPHYDDSCGVAPGSGYVNYVRVANMSCRHGKKVALKSKKKFCREHNGCPFKSDLDFYKGTVHRNGWRCKVALGYEYLRAKCRKGNQRLVYLTGA